MSARGIKIGVFEKRWWIRESPMVVSSAYKLMFEALVEGFKSEIPKLFSFQVTGHALKNCRR